MAGTVDLHRTVPGTLTGDPLFAHRAGTWLLCAAMMVVLCVVIGFAVARLLRRQEPAIMRR
jgi:ABC-type spermidine/putrescine transport system permease subunit I